MARVIVELDRTFVYDTLAASVFRRVRGRKKQARALFAVILVVMAIFGLWHGSAWHFVLFGVAQGLVIAGWAAVTKGRAPRAWTGRLFSLLVLQTTWLFSLILFRADNLSIVGQFLSGLAGKRTADPELLWCLAAVAATLLVQAMDFHVRRRSVAISLRFLRGTTAGALVASVVFVGALAVKISLDAERIASAGGPSGAGGSFIYFHF